MKSSRQERRRFFNWQCRVFTHCGWLYAIVVAVAWAQGCASRHSKATFAPAQELASQPSYPNPLQMQDGRPVTSARQWYRERKPELQALFAYYMYGEIPPRPSNFKTTLLGEYNDFLDGEAILKLVRLETGPTNAPRIDLMLVLPKVSNRVPVFLAMNFCGNEALTPDKRVPLTHSWLGSGCAGCPDHHSSEAGRGTQATNWALAEIIHRGYGLAAFYSGDIDPDRADASEGIYAWLAGGVAANNNPTNRGTIAAWAWGFQRAVDYLVTDAGVDPARIATVGHSRNGKTALLAAAYDTRIAMAFPHQAGCGGTAPSRGKVGESVKAINDRFPHWFNAEFKKFNDVSDRLPFDQHELLALCAPRPVLFSCAEEDQWSNPAGQFEVLRAATAVYQFLGAPGMNAGIPPPLGQLSAGGRLGYYIREGKHSMTAGDWRVFLDFADKQWGRHER